MTSPPPVLFVRLLPGVVGETRRVVHVVPMDEEHVTEAGLLTLCGVWIAPGTAQRINGHVGMPCERCGQRAITATPDGTF